MIRHIAIALLLPALLASSCATTRAARAPATGVSEFDFAGGRYQVPGEMSAQVEPDEEMPMLAEMSVEDASTGCHAAAVLVRNGDQGDHLELVAVSFKSFLAEVAQQQVELDLTEKRAVRDNSYAGSAANYVAQASGAATAAISLVELYSATDMVSAVAFLSCPQHSHVEEGIRRLVAVVASRTSESQATAQRTF